MYSSLGNKSKTLSQKKKKKEAIITIQKMVDVGMNAVNREHFYTAGTTTMENSVEIP